MKSLLLGGQRRFGVSRVTRHVVVAMTVACLPLILMADPPDTGQPPTDPAPPGNVCDPGTASPPQRPRPPELPAEVMAAIERTAKDASTLAQTAMPDPQALGPAWKMPWQLPPQVWERTASEDAYWEQAGHELMPAGMSPQDAAKFVDALTGMAGGGQAPAGFGQKEVLAAMLSRVRADDSPPEQRIAEMLDLARFGFESAPAPQPAVPSSPAGSSSPGSSSPDGSSAPGGSSNSGNTAGPDKDQERSQAAARARERADAEKRMTDRVLAPYKDMTASQLRDALINQLSLVQKRTEMTYYQSNDWAGLAKAGGERAASTKGIWIGRVKVKVMLLDPNRPGELKDLAKTEAAALEARLSASAHATMDAAIKVRQREVDARVAAKLKEAEDAGRAEAAATAAAATRPPPSDPTTTPPDGGGTPAPQKSPEEYAAELERIAQSYVNQPTTKPAATTQAVSPREAALREAERIKSEWAEQKQALSRLAVKVEPRNIGDNSYVIRFTGVTPDVLGAQGSLNCGWIRRGEVAVSVELSGNFPETFMTDAMNRFLSEIDAKFISSGAGL